MKKFKGFLRGLGLALVVVLGIAAWLALPWFVLLPLAVVFVAWMLLTRRGRQAGSVTQVGLSTLPQRIGASSVVIVGIAGVVAVLVALLAMAEGYRETLHKSGSDDTAIVMRGASAAEVMSTLDNASINVVSQAPGIARGPDGKPLASAEGVVAANLPLRGGAADEDGSAQLRGVGPQVWAVRPNVQIIAGRKFEPGRRELIAGVGAQRQFAGLEPGNTLHIGSSDWTVTGIFRSGDALDSELWADAGVVASAYDRGSTRSPVTVKLERASAFKGFKAALSGDPRLDVDTQTTEAYFSEQSKVMTTIIKVVGMVVGAIMGLGAVFGALNTRFATVAGRMGEIATLRAIGFRSLPVVVAVMVETMLLALAGGVLGGLIAWLVFNGYTASTIAGGVGQLTFEFHVSLPVLWTGLKWALAIGFVGGLFPALRAARLPVTDALRAA
jgi:putative ABC transport system permease protein